MIRGRVSRKNPVVHVEGAEALNRALRAVGNRATGLLLRQAAEKGAEVLAEEARRIAPRDTGRLAEGLHAKVGRVQAGRVQVNVSYDKRQWYGKLVEEGTVHQATKPFLRPALDAKKDEAKQVVGDELKRALDL